jgi:hypothetical protein
MANRHRDELREKVKKAMKDGATHFYGLPDHSGIIILRETRTGYQAASLELYNEPPNSYARWRGLPGGMEQFENLAKMAESSVKTLESGLKRLDANEAEELDGITRQLDLFEERR